MISIVSPVYRAEKILPMLVSEIDTVMVKIDQDYEIILVDDRSPDNSWEVMKALEEQNNNLKIFRLSRNFGQHPTIMAGLSKAKGDWIVVMDCDMQDQPKEIEKLYLKALEGYDIVFAKRISRQDKLFKKLGSTIFGHFYNYLAGVKINVETANFGIFKRKVIVSVLELNDFIKAFPLFVNWVGFTRTDVEVEHADRLTGESTYNFNKLLRLALNMVISFSDKPLKIFVGIGAVISCISFLTGMFFLVQAITGQITEPGFSSLILSIWFLSGMIISCIGIVGIYVGKTFNQTKNRPIFIIDEEK